MLAPPVVSGGKFRMLERHQWKGMDFAAQAEGIRKLTEKYNVEYIGIDATASVSACSSWCAHFTRRHAASVTHLK